jgi:hypothetical protein
MPSFLDPQHLISTFGLIGILAIVFAESGLLIGFFLPATRCCSPPACWSPTAPICTSRCG